MQASQTPTLVPLAFAANGTKNTIPEASQIGVTPGAASLNDGFPPLTFTPVAAGGVPPAGADFNGVLNLITASIRWAHGGGRYAFSSSFAADANVSGYPQGAQLMSADLLGTWISLNDSNTDNPDTGAGTKWVPGQSYGVTAVTGLTNANVTLTPAQAAKSRITLAGTLTANVQIIFPTWLKDWTVVNNTTGAFTVTCKTAAGSGVTVQSGGVSSKIYGDGTNINQDVQTTGRVLRTSIYAIISGQQQVSVNGGAFTTVGATIFAPLSNTLTVIGEAQGGGGAGGGTSGTTSTNVSLGAPGGSGTYGKSQWPVATIGASQTITVGAGGTGSTGAGTNGGQSSIGTLLIAPGGGGGSVLNNVAPPQANGNGGFSAAPTGANQVTIRGSAVSASQSIGSASSAIAGTGGSTPYGPGATGNITNTNGNAAVNWGTGGSGSVTNSTGGSSTGGAGFSGVVIITELA